MYWISDMEKFEFSRAFDYVWEKVQNVNKRIDEKKPWMLAKNGEMEKLSECLKELIVYLLNVNYMISPFITDVAEKIFEIFAGEIEPPKVPLFPKA